MNLKKIKDSQRPLVDHLISLLSDEYLAWYAYEINCPFIIGDNRPDVQEFIKTAAEDELHDHASALLKRLHELQAQVPVVIPTPCSWNEYAQCIPAQSPLTLVEFISARIQDEKAAIAHYQEVIPIAESLADYTTRDILKHNLADEEDHLTQLNDLLIDLTHQ